jgi:hypothetical protein
MEVNALAGLTINVLSTMKNIEIKITVICFNMSLTELYSPTIEHTFVCLFSELYAKMKYRPLIIEIKDK